MTHNLNQNILNLSKNEQTKLFELITHNAELFAKLIPNLELLESIKTQTFNHANDPVVVAYLAWKNKL